MHGMGDFANDPFGMVPLKNDISEYLGGAYVLNVQIGDNSIQDILNGFIMNLDDQVDYFAKVVQGDSQLTKGECLPSTRFASIDNKIYFTVHKHPPLPISPLGFNAVGYSQGNILIRGYIERYNNPPVLNFISMHGPLSGVAGLPGCAMEQALCKGVDEFLGALVYKPAVQNHLAQANYYRDPRKIDAYLEGDRFLADINNEKNTTTASYKANWASLNSVCLVKALADTVVVPNDSEWFAFYKDGSLTDKWTFEQTPWYVQDTFGLKTLNEKGHVFFNTTTGDHLDFDTDYLLDLVGLYFV
jgi:palmitoyl-protein thioesterase